MKILFKYSIAMLIPSIDSSGNFQISSKAMDNSYMLTSEKLF